jgi:hypothetical protein
LRPEGEQLEESRESGAVEVKAVVEERQVGEQIDEAYTLGL